VRARPGGQDDPHGVASCPSLVSYDVNRCLGPVVVVRPRRRWWGYVLRGLDNNGGFGTGVMEANARGQNGASMSSPDCQWLRGRYDSKSTIGLIRGGTLWVGAGRARVRQHSGVVAVTRCGIPVEVTKLSPVYNLFSLSRSFVLVFLCTHFHKGGNRVLCIAASRMQR
jgi:hypothetical protein